MLLFGVVFYGGKYFPLKLVDFSVYWSAGSVAVEGGNPYNPDEAFRKLELTGWTTQDTKLLLYWYPPWTLPLSMPLGLLSFKTSQILWYLFSVGIILFCASVLWQLYNGHKKGQWLAWMTGLLFSPTIYVLYFGQISPLILLGITGFLFFITRKSEKTDLFAGVCTGLISIKPALLFLFWPALLFWCISQHRWKVLLGLFFTLTGGALVSWIFNPHIFQHYWNFLNTARVVDWGVPTVGSWLRRVWGPDKILLQFLPPLVGFGWFWFHWVRNRENWRWEEQISWLSLVSLVTAAFAWTHDQVVLLPAIIEATSRVNLHFRTGKALGFISAWVIFNLFLFISHFARDDSQFVWQAPAILIFYLSARYLFGLSPRSGSSSPSRSELQVN